MHRRGGVAVSYNPLLIDIHSHLLPALDDGANSLDEAITMARMAAEGGTTDIVATPHANDRYCYNPETVRARIRELQEVCGDIIRIYAGCDFHLSFSNIEDALRYPRKYTINGGRYMLVEFSDFAIPPNISAVFEKMLAADMTPIITHPERNPLLQRNLSLLAD